MTNKKIGTMIVDFLRKLFTKDLAFKILALLFAVMIWGLVMAVQNPERVKTVQDVNVSFEGEADLHARNLVVRYNVLDQLGGLSVRVSTKTTNYPDVTKDNITATVSLRNVTTTGIKTLPINATIPARLGTVENNGINPASVDVEIDTLVSKTVPVEIQYNGTLPEGYWADAAELSAQTVTVRGAKQDMQHVTKAICRIEMTNRTSNYNDAVTVSLFDKQGNQMDASCFLDELPTVNVKMTVLRKKTVSFAVQESLLGVDNLPANYELVSVSATPATVDIVGDANTLDAIETLSLEGLDIGGKREGTYAKRAVVLPEGVRLLGLESGEVEVFADIREKVTQKKFEQVPISQRGLARGLEATLSSETTDVDVSGRISILELLERKEVEAYVDLEGLKEGEYTLYVSAYLNDDETTVELAYLLSTPRVTVIIKQK